MLADFIGELNPTWKSWPSLVSSKEYLGPGNRPNFAFLYAESPEKQCWQVCMNGVSLSSAVFIFHHVLLPPLL